MKNEIVKKNFQFTENDKFSNFVVFQTEKGKVNIDVYFFDETLWLTQKKMGELFSVDVRTISEHLRNIYSSLELKENATIRKIRIVQKEGTRNVSRQVDFYNLKAIVAVGYRVNSHRATEFRKWATDILHEYIIKGFAMDDERLKQIKHFGKDYFNEMLERIREIRLSERRLYQKITDIYALSADYDKNAEMTKEFFATVQNKLHWAITGKTAAEIIYSEADAKKIFMGLKTWKKSPEGKILKSDVTIAKNYLNEQHLRQLERLVNAFLDLAENRAEREIVMNMQDWIVYLDKFLQISDYPILTDKGKVSALEAKLKAEGEYDKFRVEQDRNYVSDFDEEVKRLLGNEKKN